MCDIHLRKSKQTLDFEVFKKTINILKGTVAYFPIGGGEPLMVPNIIEYLEYAKKNIPYVHMNSNGALITEKLAKEFERIKLDEIAMSLDGPPEVHNKFRGNPNAYNNLMNAIKTLREHAPGVKIIINTLFAHWNYRYIPELVDLTERLGVSHLFQPLTNLYGNELDNEDIDPLMKIPEEEVVRLTKLLMTKKHVVNNNFFLAGLPYYFRTGRSPIHMKKCYMPKIYLELNFDGRFKVCGYILGKNKDWDIKNLRNILNSKEYQAHVKALRNCDLCEKSYTSCYWEPRLLFPVTNFLKYTLRKPKIKK